MKAMVIRQHGGIDVKLRRVFSRQPADRRLAQSGNNGLAAWTWHLQAPRFERNEGVAGRRAEGA